MDVLEQPPRTGIFLRFLCVSSIFVVYSSLATDAFGQQQPNVIVLLADDLGFKDIGCYDGPVDTPHIDALAEGGSRFTDFYSGCAVCSPSRASLLTGRHHIRTGVYSWIHDASQRSHLLEREITLAELLKTHGYATAHIGKWHLGLPTEQHDKPTPADHGFDYWFATGNNASPSHHNPDNFIRNGEPVGRLDGYSCDLVAAEAIHWLDSRQGDTPYFLNVWFHEPHAPIAAPKAAIEPYGKPDNKLAVYSGTIHNTDRAIGRLLEVVHRLDAPNDTLIIYASDNGTYQKRRTGNLKGTKGSNWEGGIRVPGIFYWPGKVNHSVNRQPAGIVDVLPTVCGLLDIPPPAQVHLDGSDLSPLLTGQSEQFRRHQPLFWHLQKSRPIVAIRSDQWSLVADPAFPLSQNNMFQESWIPEIRSGSYTNFRLFDLSNDPGQENDVARANPEVFEHLRSQLLEINSSIMADGVVW